VALSALGLGVGVIAGMFGVGGGFLLTPLLSVAFRVPISVAVGTGLCQMIGVASSAYLRHQRLGQGEVKMDWLMMAGSLLGVTLGAQAVNALDGLGRITVIGHEVPAARFWLSCGYAVLLGAIAAWMLKDARRASPPGTGPPPPGPLARLRIPPYTRLPRTGHVVSVPLVAYLGLAMGFLSGLLGIGGGVALMPVLLYGFGMRVKMAAGTGVLVLLVTCVVGTFAHALAGHVHLGMATMLLVGSTLGAQVGATLTARLSGQTLRGYFAYLVLATVGAVLWGLARTVFGGG
jgi:uncharacterized membrane protein YfcA